MIDGVKLDLSFPSMAELRAATADEIAVGDRIPIVAESVVLFDKDGELAALRADVAAARPKAVAPEERNHLQFMVYHLNDKAERNLADDPTSSLLVMSTGLMDLLNMHYRIRGRWKVSTKRMFADLRAWDEAMAGLVERFLNTPDAAGKFAIWTAIVDHVLAPLGGRLPIAENNCGCPVCRRDLAAILGGR